MAGLDPAIQGYEDDGSQSAALDGRLRGGHDVANVGAAMTSRKSPVP